MTNVKKQDFTRRISRANATEMIVILYDMVLTYIQDGIEEAQASDLDAFHEEIGHIQGCMSELINSLDMRYAPAEELLALYSFIIKRLAIADAKRDASILTEVSRIIEPLRDAYSQIVEKNTQGPVMGNSQEVYAGLTYGRRDLTESLSVQVNRGFYV